MLPPSLASKLVRASSLEPPAFTSLFPTGLEPLDAVLGGGLPRGCLVEITSATPRASTGRFSLALAALAAATQVGETAALVDPSGHLDPRSAARAGVELSRLLWARPGDLRASLSAAGSLLSAGFFLVVLNAIDALDSMNAMNAMNRQAGSREATPGVPRPSRLSRTALEAAWLRLSRTARLHRAVLLVLSSRPLCGTAAGVVVSTDRVRSEWLRREGALPLLDGLSSELSLQRGLARLTTPSPPEERPWPKGSKSPGPLARHIPAFGARTPPSAPPLLPAQRSVPLALRPAESVAPARPSRSGAKPVRPPQPLRLAPRGIATCARPA